ncbi:TolC family protein [candidate division KSB1 bacterium]
MTIIRNVLFTLFSVSLLNTYSAACQSGEMSHPAESSSADTGSDTPDSVYAETITLESLIDEAIARNPGLQAHKRSFEASRARIPQAGAWMDPKLNFSIMNFPVSEFGFDLEPMTQKQVSLMQSIPFPGITGLKSDIASYEADIAEQYVSESENSIIKRISVAFYEIAFIDKAAGITKMNKELLKSLHSIAAKKYEVGKGLQQDVLKAQVEISKVTDRLISYRARREAVVSELNGLLNRPPGSPTGPLAAVEYAPVNIDIEQLRQAALTSQPRLRVLRTEAQKNSAVVELSKKTYWPNFDLGIAYSQRDNRRDFFSAQFSVNLPIWKSRKQDKQVEESILRLRSVERRQEEMRLSIDSQIAAVTAKIRESDERLRLLRDVIIPQARQALNSAVSGYEVGNIDFLTLLNNQITLFELEIDFHRLLSVYNKDIVSLEYIVGSRAEEHGLRH